MRYPSTCKGKTIGAEITTAIATLKVENSQNVQRNIHRKINH